jgi:CBS domain-containing protein
MAFWAVADREVEMFVDLLLSAAREHLVTIPEDAPLIKAAGLLHTGTDLAVVCRADGTVAGVVTKTDVVDQISHCQGASCTCALSTVMSRDLLVCRPGDSLIELWARMKERGFKNVPLVDPDSRPLGIVTARDALQILLAEAENEESLLRDYVMGFGYR